MWKNCWHDISNLAVTLNIDLAVMYGQGFIDVNVDSDGYGTFDVPDGSNLNTFDAGNRLVLKAQSIKEKADILAATGDYSNGDMCDSLLKEFHSARTLDGKHALFNNAPKFLFLD